MFNLNKIVIFSYACVSAALIAAAPIAYSVAGEGASMGQDWASASVQIEAQATFVPAAKVEFRHDAFTVTEDAVEFFSDEKPGLFFKVENIHSANIAVFGASGEVAQLGCEIQRMEKSRVETFIPVFSQKCSGMKKQNTILNGNNAENDVLLSKGEQGLSEYTSYVSLEISYI